MLLALLLNNVLAANGDGSSTFRGFERFSNVPSKRIPNQVKKIVYDLVDISEQHTVKDLRIELKLREIEYDPSYGDYLKQVIKLIIAERKLIVAQHVEDLRQIEENRRIKEENENDEIAKILTMMLLE